MRQMFETRAKIKKRRTEILTGRRKLMRGYKSKKTCRVSGENVLQCSANSDSVRDVQC